MASDEISEAIASLLGSYPVSGNVGKSLAPVLSTGITVLDEVEQQPVRLGNLVEISGVTMSGKTQLLHAITANILLNYAHEKGPVVCWFDLNRGLDPNRLRDLMRVKLSMATKANPDDRIEGCNGLRLYYPTSTISMCASLHALEQYMSTEDGKGVKAIVIDSLGSFHYIDKYIFERAVTETPATKQSHELVLGKVVEKLLSLQKVVVFASKACLFDETALDVTWPFPQAGVPMIPKEFMPDLWKNLITHKLLMYHIETPSDEQSSSRRGVIAMRYPKSSVRKAIVSAAAVAVVDNERVAIDSLHIVT